MAYVVFVPIHLACGINNDFEKWQKTQKIQEYEYTWRITESKRLDVVVGLFDETDTAKKIAKSVLADVYFWLLSNGITTTSETPLIYDFGEEKIPIVFKGNNSIDFSCVSIIETDSLKINFEKNPAISWDLIVDFPFFSIVNSIGIDSYDDFAEIIFRGLLKADRVLNVNEKFRIYCEILEKIYDKLPENLQQQVQKSENVCAEVDILIAELKKHKRLDSQEQAKLEQYLRNYKDYIPSKTKCKFVIEYFSGWNRENKALLECAYQRRCVDAHSVSEETIKELLENYFSNSSTEKIFQKKKGYYSPNEQANKMKDVVLNVTKKYIEEYGNKNEKGQ